MNNKQLNLKTSAINCLSLFVAAANLSAKENKTVQPNIIYILADDLGYGDVSCYGQKKFSTPNIDKLAQNGMRFINHYSGSTVSAPTRACLMSGLHTGHSFIRGNTDNTLPTTSRIFPQMLQNEGYVTGMFGKWGLGNYPSTGEPGKHGFNQFFGFSDQGLAHRMYPDVILSNGENVVLNGNDWTNKVVYTPDTIHKKALNFIDENKNNRFFLYYCQTIPHAELLVPDDSIFQRFKGTFTESPFKGANYIGSTTDKVGYCSQPFPKATYVSMITRLDMYIGQIIKKLEELGLSENTIIMFSSDNGPHTEGGADPVFFNSTGGLRGVKRDLYEGGIRVPFIIKWQGKIAANSVSEIHSAHWDIFPTLKEIVNSTENYVGDGNSLLPTLLNTGVQDKHRYLYWEFFEYSGRRAVRWGDWKLVQYNMTSNPNASVMLYNLKTDLAESTNVATSNKDIADKLTNALEIEHIKSDKLYWTFENNKNLRTIKILIVDKNGNPINNAKILLTNYGNRITWDEGIGIYRGVSAGTYNLSVNINGLEVSTSQLVIGSVDINKTIEITTTDVMKNLDNTKLTTSCFYDKTLNSIRVKSSQPLSSYKLFDSVGKLISNGDCFGTYFNIELTQPTSKFVILEFVAANGSNIKVKCL
jgi:arylsulfatase A-like enzyme